MLCCQTVVAVRDSMKNASADTQFAKNVGVVFHFKTIDSGCRYRHRNQVILHCLHEFV